MLGKCVDEITRSCVFQLSASFLTTGHASPTPLLSCRLRAALNTTDLPLTVTFTTGVV